NERARIASIAEHCVNKQMRRTVRTLSNFYDEKMRVSGLHGNQVITLVVPYLAGPVSINKMAEHLGLDRTTLVRNLKLIEERGLITITPGKDRRTRIVTLTSSGREALANALPLWEEAQREVLELLGAQHAELLKVLATMNGLEEMRNAALPQPHSR